MDTDLFGETESEVIRTLGFYQPFCSLMEFGKVETRWVRKGKKPPFPFGKYLFYSTIRMCENSELFEWCGAELMLSIGRTVILTQERLLNKAALSIGTLVTVRLMTKADEEKAFVKFIGERTVIKKGVEVVECQWCLVFINVQIIEPFEWKFGKQGVGFVPASELPKIKLLTNQKQSNQ